MAVKRILLIVAMLVAVVIGFGGSQAYAQQYYGGSARVLDLGGNPSDIWSSDPPPASFDITNLSYVIRSGDPTPSGMLPSTPLSTLQAYTVYGSDGGAWDTFQGIWSSYGRTHAGSPAVFSGADWNNINGGPIFGVKDVNNSDSVIMYTYTGDVNLDGVVDGLDFGAESFWYHTLNGATPTNPWIQGDVNYDGVVDGLDFGALSFGLHAQGDQIPVFGSGSGGAGAQAVTLSGATPEPTSLVLLALGFVGAVVCWVCKRR